MDMKTCFSSFLFIILLCLNFQAKFVFPANASSPVGEQECQPCVGQVGVRMTLKVEVPKKKGFTEFVSVCEDDNGKDPCYTGFSIDVFNAALQRLSFKVEPQYNALETEEYDDLLEDITAEKYDAVVGDVTIKGYRATSVDLTVSYMDSSVYVLVPLKHGTRKNMWIFLKPLSLTLWFGIVMAFMFVGILIGTMEMRSNVTNTDFSGRILHKLFMMIWYPVSLLVLPERRMVVSIWSKLVVVVWLYTAFVIMQSYTANLTTMLTIDQLRPYFDMKGNYSVGYQEGSFVKKYLIEERKFNEARLREYSTIEDYHNGLSKGSDNGGVAAIYDELPYIKLFLQQYGSEYTVDGPILRTNGWGFAFPLNSCLAPLISKAIMNATDDGEITKIEEKYFGKKAASEVDISRLPEETPSLDAYNFLGIFIVAVGLSIIFFLCSEIWGQFDERVPSSSKVFDVNEGLPIIETQDEHPSLDYIQSFEIVSRRKINSSRY